MADQPTDQPPPPTGPSHLWRDQDSLRQLAVQVSQARRRRTLLLLVVMFIFLSALVTLLLWLTPVPYPYLVGTWITDYQVRQVPLPMQLEHDRTAFQEANFFPRKNPNVFQSLDRATLIQDLSDLANRSPVESVVVYLAGQARTGDSGEVFLLPADADPANKLSWIGLRRALELVRACPSRSKLVVLDIMAPLADARLGILADDVGRGVQLDLQAVEDPHRLALCSCSPGQVALASPEMGRTVFNYYLEEGLRGWADGYKGIDKPDRRIAVRELAEFVQARVDRWAWNNRQTRQTPLLTGAGPDFFLLVMKNGTPLPHLTAAPPSEYPPWLLDGWKMREAWLAEEVYRTVPHLFRELDAVLLEAEREWLNGVESTRARDNRQQQLKGLAARKQLFRFPAQPEPYSLALAVAQGHTVDKETIALLREVQGKRKPTEGGKAATPPPDKGDAKTAGGKAPDAKAAPPKPAPEKGPDPLELLKGKPHFDVAAAAFDLMASDPDPTPEKIRVVNALLQEQEPRPRYVETLFLQRLGEMATQLGTAPWPKDTVHTALEVVRLGERAASMPEAFAWVRGPLEEASQRRQEGETVLFARGYASIDDAELNFKKAITSYEICLAQAETIRKAQRFLDDALATLPAYIPYIERVPRYEKDWLAAVDVADELYRSLAPPAPGQTLTIDELRRKGDEIRNKTDELQARLDELRRPFAPESWEGLKDVAARKDASATHLLEIGALLATPFLKPADRQALWKGRLGLAARLQAQTRTVDEAEDAGEQPVSSRLGGSTDPARLAHAERDHTARRARLSIGWLRLGGLPSGEIHELNEAYAGAEAAAPEAATALWYALGQALRKAWNERLPDMLEHNDDSAARDRLSRVFSAYDVGIIQTDDPVTPQIQLQQAQARALWAWLADRSRYANRDGLNLGLPPGGAPALYATAASTYRQVGRTLPDEEFVQISSPTPAVDLPTSGTATYLLQLRLFAPPTAKTTARLRILTADNAWLQVTPVIEGLDPGATEATIGLPHLAVTEVTLRVQLKPGAALTRVPPPRGFLVQVQINGRSYHYLVPVSLQGVTDRLEILLSADPTQPIFPIGDLRLRPVKPQQPFYLYVRNPTDRPRNLVVQLLGNGRAVPGAETKLPLLAKETRRVLFPQPPALPPPPAGAVAPPPAELSEFQGPIEVRLLDADKRNALVESKVIRVGVASPREYVQVANILYRPADPRARTAGPLQNRLDVSLRTLLTGGPPCTAELILPPERIPGLSAVKDGNLRGVLPFTGEALKLYAVNLQLTTGADEEGYTYLSVDGCTRAFVFRTTFARWGDPYTPREDNQPAVRLHAPSFGRTGVPLPVDIEVDNEPAGATLEVNLGISRDGIFEPETTRKLPTGRETRIGFAPSGPNGALLFEAMIRDWHVEMDTLRIKGTRTLLARLLDGSGRPIRVAEATITLDDSPAAKVRFVDPPAKHRKDAPLPIVAFGQPPVAGLKEVNFFFGKPVDNKVPPNTPLIAATAVDDSQSLWGARVPLDGGRKGPTDLSVEFRSMAGLSTFATTNIELTDGDPPLDPGKIEGTVVEGTRKQAGLDVTLRTERNEDKDKTTTDEEGFFKFENVQPGRYKIIASKPATKRNGVGRTVVEPNKTSTVQISLIAGPAEATKTGRRR